MGRGCEKASMRLPKAYMKPWHTPQPAQGSEGRLIPVKSRNTEEPGVAAEKGARKTEQVRGHGGQMMWGLGNGGPMKNFEPNDLI